MGSVVKEIEVNVEDFDIIDIINEIQNRGYKVSRNDRPSFPFGKIQEDIEHLYDTYRTCSENMFRKELEELFRKYVI